MRPKRTLLGMITKEAMRTFPEDLVMGEVPMKENWNLWVDHWHKVAEKIYQGFRDEGLIETAKAVREHIDWQKEHVK